MRWVSWQPQDMAPEWCAAHQAAPSDSRVAPGVASEGGAPIKRGALTPRRRRAVRSRGRSPFARLEGGASNRCGDGVTGDHAELDGRLKPTVLVCSLTKDFRGPDWSCEHASVVSLKKSCTSLPVWVRRAYAESTPPQADVAD